MTTRMTVNAAPNGWTETLKESQPQRQMRRELITPPYYSVVTLFGKGSRRTLNSAAENLTTRLEGVVGVHNEFEVRPLSPNGDPLRLAPPPTAIIVNHGNVALAGVVMNALQRSVAAAQANTVAGLFAVSNNLPVEANN